MKIVDLCERDIVTVLASASVREAAAAMRDQHVGALAVTDPYEPGRVIGIVTDRDLVLELLATGRPVEGQAIGSLCRTDLAGVAANASLDEAIRAMQRSGVRRLLVMGDNDQVVGLVAMDDLVHAVAGELDALAGTLRTGVIREGSRLRARAAADEPPRPLYITRNEP
jgi:CBS domain-containing protein